MTKNEDSLKKRFRTMTRDERAEVVRTLMAADNSFGSAANILGVKRGLVAGICRDYHIATRRSPGFKELPKSSSGVVLRFAANDEERCKAPINGFKCRYVREPGSDYCARPEHQALAQKLA